MERKEFFIVVFNNGEQLWINTKDIIAILVKPQENTVEIRSVVQGNIVVNTHKDVDIEKTLLV